jgi:hypothetical protein
MENHPNRLLVDTPLAQHTYEFEEAYAETAYSSGNTERHVSLSRES